MNFVTVAISQAPDSVFVGDEVKGGGHDVQVILLRQHILANNSVLKWLR